MQLEVWAGADENDVSPLPTRSTEISSKSTLLRRVEPKIAELGGGMSFSRNLSQWLERDLSGRRLASIPGAKVCIASDVGLVREENQDRAVAMWMTCPAHGEVFVSVVSDGMGGMRDGGRCATIAITSFLYFISHFSSKDLLSDIIESIQYSNSEVNRIYGGRGGATLSVLALTVLGERFVANVGDSRVYSFGTPRGVRRWTVDDSLAEVVGGSGRELVQFVGMGLGIRPSAVELVGDDYCFAITSDGVHSLDESTLFDVMKNSSSVAQLTERLVAISRWCGGRDNSSCIVLDVSGVDLTTMGFNSGFVRIWDSAGELSIALDEIALGDSYSSPREEARVGHISGVSGDGARVGAEEAPADAIERGGLAVEKQKRKPRKVTKKSAKKRKSADDDSIQLSIEIGSQKNSGG